MRALVKLITHAKEIDENSVVEYKVEPHSMDYECEFYKDILALLNSYDRPAEDRWLVYGVDNKTRTPIGFDINHGGLLDDSSYQQKFHRISPRPVIELITVDGEIILGEGGIGKQFAAFYIPCENAGSVYELSVKIKDKEPKPRKTSHVIYYEGMAFVRCGSSTKPLREEDRIRIREIAERETSFPPSSFVSVGDGLASRKIETSIATLTDPVDNLRLLGSWDERNECDKQSIADLCGVPYEHAIRMLKDDLDSGLFTVNKSTWIVRDRLSMVESVGPHLTGASLDAIASRFARIIASVDEKYALPDDQRIMVDIMGVSRGCSQSAREGAASLCAILANNHAFVPNCTKRSIETFVSKVMMSVLSTDDWRVLASADTSLPLLAQASPSTYLSLIEQCLQGHTAIADFLDQETGRFASIKLGWGLLRGIRIAAMKEECLSQAISLLVRLLPSTDMAKEAIVSTLLPWLPQTEAPVASRKGMGRFLAKQHNPKAWQALLELLPNRTTSAMSASEPEYLETPDFSAGVSVSEFWEVSHEYCRDVLEGARGYIDRTIDIVSCIDSFKTAGMLDDLAAFLHDGCSSFAEMEKYKIWSSLLSYVERCERFADADWAPSADDLRVIKAVADDMAPTGVYFQALRACSLDDFELAYADNVQAQLEAALAERQNVLKPLYEEEGLTIVDRITNDGAKGRYIGAALAGIVLSSNDEQLLLSFLDAGYSEGNQQVDVARSYIWEKFKLSGWDWADSVSIREWPLRRIALYYAALPFSKKCWSDAERVLGNHASMYWAETPYAWVIDDADDVNHCVDQLLKVNRAAFALEVMHFSISEGVAVNSDMVLKAISQIRGNEVDTMGAYHIKELFKYVEKAAPNDSLCVQELRFAELLSDKPDAYLFTRMSQDYKLFAQVVALAYAGSKTNEVPDGSSALNRWAIRYRVLKNWVIVPGFENDGMFSESLFETWLAGAKVEAEALGVLEGAEHEIGRNLFHTPQMENGLFMPDAMASFIEESDAALEGFAIEAFNSRGAHFVDRTGKQEDEIADSYEKKAVSAEGNGYARFAACLRGIAKSYRQEAEDNRNGE